jgi:predicted amidohydrolase YtcJ
MHADLIVRNARLMTFDPNCPRASSLAAWDGRILAVGDEDAVEGLRGPATDVVDLGGRFACPGLTDCHVHLGQWALGASGRMVNLDGARSMEEALQRVVSGRERAVMGGWLRGRGWDKNQWGSDRFPTAADLDAVTGDVPAALPSHDGHSLWVNTAGMNAAGITPQTEAPPTGRILRDDGGRPTGIFQEGAMGLIWGHVPSPSVEELACALRDALPIAASLGLTRVHNCEAADSTRALQRLREDGALTLRITRFVPAADLGSAVAVALYSGLGDEWIRIAGIKAFLDGAIGGQTAAMLEPYAGTSDSGQLVMEPEELLDIISRATQARLAVALHAIGDRAVRLGLDAFAQVRAQVSHWPRHRIEHAQHIHPDDQPRFGALEVIASVQPVHMLADIATCERHVPGRTAWAFPLRGLLESGACLAMGSDAPVETIDPLAGIRSAVLRQGHDGWPEGGWHREQALTVAEALRGYTLDAAYAGGEEALGGSLTAGKVADLVVLTHDPTADLESLQAARVAAAVVGGRAVHDPEGIFAPYHPGGGHHDRS